MNEGGDWAAAHTWHDRPLSRRMVEPASVIHLIEAQLRRRPDTPCLMFADGDERAMALTGAEVDRRRRHAACWLRQRMGVTPGDVVGLIAANDERCVIAMLGLLSLGSAVLLLSARDPPERLRSQIAAVDNPPVLRSALAGEMCLPGSVVIPSPEEAARAIEVDLPTVAPAADAFIVGTSGSTAASKLVVQSQYAAAVNAVAISRHHALGPGVRLLGCLPIYHVNGLHFTVLASLASGALAIVADGFDAFGYRALAERHRPHVASVVPSILEALAATWRTSHVPGELRYFVSAAAPLMTSTARAVHERLGLRVLQGYGLTETVNFSTTMPTDLDPASYTRWALDADIPSVGIALDGNVVAILDPEGGMVGPGEPGELCMRGHNVMSRYHGNHEATATALRGGWFHSQDLGYRVIDEPTGRSFFVITGRDKNVAKIRGESVSLEEVDRALLALPGVLDAAAIAIPDRWAGEQIIAAVAATGTVSPEAIRSSLSNRLPTSAVPSRIVQLDAIPRTATGKVLRQQLAGLVISR